MQMNKNKKLLEKEIFVDHKYCQETEKQSEFLYYRKPTNTQISKENVGSKK